MPWLREVAHWIVTALIPALEREGAKPYDGVMKDLT
jgi:hypothetical protein